MGAGMWSHADRIFLSLLRLAVGEILPAVWLSFSPFLSHPALLISLPLSNQQSSDAKHSPRLFFLYQINTVSHLMFVMSVENCTNIEGLIREGFTLKNILLFM